MSEPVKGVTALIAACVIWGLSPLFYKAIAHIGPLEVQSHRVIWSLALFGLLLLFQGRIGEIVALLGRRRTLLLAIGAAVTISTNWFLFIVSIQVGRTVEASLGYYIFPLVAVLFGVLAFGERLNLTKWGAVGLAFVAVLVLTIGLGSVPWISLILAFTFGLYGLFKKWTEAGPVVSVTVEVLLVAPLAVIWLWGVHAWGWGGMFGRPGGIFGTNFRDSAMLMTSGLMTAGPLVLFSYASRRITLATLGLVQYLNPTLQFICAVAVFGEVFTKTHATAFGLIWVALAIYSAQAFVQERAARKADVKSVKSSNDLI